MINSHKIPLLNSKFMILYVRRFYMTKSKQSSDNRKKIFWALFSILLAVLTVWTVLKQSDGVSLKDLVAIVSDANPFWFFTAVASMLLFVFFEAVALRSVLRSAGYKKPLRQSLIYSTSDIYFSAITPSASGGQPASAYFMLKDKIPGGTVTATLILNLMTYTIAIVVIGIVSVLLRPDAFFSFGYVSEVLIVIGFVCLFALRRGDKIFSLISRIIVFFTRKKKSDKVTRVLNKIDKLKKDYSDCSALIAGSHAVILRSLFWNLLTRFSQIAVPMFLFLSLGGSFKTSVTVFVNQTLTSIGSNIIPIPGAMGISDYLLIDGFTPMMGRDMAFQFDLLSRGISFYICVILSGIITLIGYIVGRRKNDRRL